MRTAPFPLTTLSGPGNAPVPYKMEDVIRHSFRDFHAKGMDYLCLLRSPARTVKVYFLDGDVAKLPEVVCPHDHRYTFTSTVLAGRMVNRTYFRRPPGPAFDPVTPAIPNPYQPYEAFDFMTPLNGGNGFTHRGTEWLCGLNEDVFEAGQAYVSAPEEIHTIQMLADQTVLVLDQGRDTVPLDKPTSTWSPCGGPRPNLSGLYNKMTPDHVLARLATLTALTGIAFEEEKT
jgi:hypothetical protein